MTSAPAPIVCLHSSGASGRQWRRLQSDAAAAGHDWTWHAPDLLGHGNRPGWPQEAVGDLGHEARALLGHLGIPPEQALHLVGHSYGGATALQIAVMQPDRVRSLTLYEPVAFGVLAALGDDLPEWREARDAAAAVTAALARGDADDAARGFVGYWQGRDVWPELDVPQRARLAEPMPTISHHFDALFAARWTPAQLSTLRMPVRLIVGGASRASARRVAQTLAGLLPNVQAIELEGAGHMAPIADAARVNPLILEHLAHVHRSPAGRG